MLRTVGFVDEVSRLKRRRGSSPCRANRTAPPGSAAASREFAGHIVPQLLSKRCRWAAATLVYEFALWGRSPTTYPAQSRGVYQRGVSQSDMSSASLGVDVCGHTRRRDFQH
jgi:hypothetical protein